MSFNLYETIMQMCVSINSGDNVVQYREWSESAGILWEFRQLQQH